MTVQAPIPIPVQRVEGQTFVGANVQTDGFVLYSKCTFETCTMLYNGGNYMVQADCTLKHCRWMFGGFAGNLANTLKNLYSQGGKTKEMVEAFITQIRTIAPVPQQKKDASTGSPEGTVQ